MLASFSKRRGRRRVWNYDPISRGLKPAFSPLALSETPGEVWNYDPISRGLKLSV